MLRNLIQFQSNDWEENIPLPVIEQHTPKMQGIKEYVSSRPIQKKPKRIRTAFTTEQILELEKEFQEQEFVDRTKRLQLVNRLGLSDRNIKVWFQNRRMKKKRDANSDNITSCSDYTPPQSPPNLIKDLLRAKHPAYLYPNNHGTSPPMPQQHQQELQHTLNPSQYMPPEQLQQPAFYQNFTYQQQPWECYNYPPVNEVYQNYGFQNHQQFAAPMIYADYQQPITEFSDIQIVDDYEAVNAPNEEHMSFVPVKQDNCSADQNNTSADQDNSSVDQDNTSADQDNTSADQDNSSVDQDNSSEDTHVVSSFWASDITSYYESCNY